MVSTIRGVKLAAPLVQQSVVRDLVREGVLERVLEIWIEPGLVEKLGRLQSVEFATEDLLREVDDRLEQHARYVLADDGGDLQEAFVFE